MGPSHGLHPLRQPRFTARLPHRSHSCSSALAAVQTRPGTQSPSLQCRQEPVALKRCIRESALSSELLGARMGCTSPQNFSHPPLTACLVCLARPLVRPWQRVFSDGSLHLPQTSLSLWASLWLWAQALARPSAQLAAFPSDGPWPGRAKLNGRYQALALGRMRPRSIDTCSFNLSSASAAAFRRGRSTITSAFKLSCHLRSGQGELLSPPAFV